MAGKEAAIMRSFIASLPREQRLIMMLHYADGLTEREIASVLRKKPGVIGETLRKLRAGASSALGISSTPTLAATA